VVAEQVPLIQITWIDLSSTPVKPGEPTTMLEGMTQLVEQQIMEAWRSHIAWRIEQNPGSVDPWALDEQVRIHDLAVQVARRRIDQFEEQLDKFLDTNPTHDEVMDWLTNRILVDSGYWARIDTTAARHDADEEFYLNNPEARIAGPFTIEPLEAVCEDCKHIVGEVYDTYEEAASALDDAWHYNCPHYVTNLETGEEE
jgi:hypothetical protein